METRQKMHGIGHVACPLNLIIFSGGHGTDAGEHGRVVQFLNFFGGGKCILRLTFRVKSVIQMYDVDMMVVYTY